MFAGSSPVASRYRSLPTTLQPPSDRDGNCSTTTMRAMQRAHFRKLNGNSAANAVYWCRYPPSQRRTAMQGRHLRLLCIASLLSVMLGVRVTPAATPEAYDPWPGLVQDIFNNRPMNDGADVIGIEMPYRAEDAAIVPVTLRTTLSPTDERRIVSITLVIDQNPAPMAAKFELGRDAKVS